MEEKDNYILKRDIINLDIKRELAVKFLNNNPKATFNNLFEFIPKTTLAAASGINTMRMTPRAENPNLFRVSDLVSLANFLKVPPERIFLLALASLPTDKQATQKQLPAKSGEK